MNLNDWAREITLEEGGKISISIAQVKEVMRLILIDLAQMDDWEIEMILKRYR